MNLKFNAVILFVGIVLGGYTMKKMTPSCEPQLPQLIEQKKVNRVVVTHKDGSTEVKEEIVSSKESRPVLVVKNHTVALIPKYRLDNKEAELGAMYTYKNIGVYASGNKTGLKEIGFALSYSF